MPAPLLNLVGKTYQKLTVIGPPSPDFVPAKSQKELVHYLCLCECGKQVNVAASKLHRGMRISCGCARKLNNFRHGMSRSGGKYNAWKSMVQRCHSPTSDKYRWYGARGISVCDRWRFGDGSLTGYECFVADTGERPAGMSLDRINNDGNYEPGNCRWATAKQQANNKRRRISVTINGETKSLVEWAEFSGVPIGRIWSRYYAGGRRDETLISKDFLCRRRTRLSPDET